MPGDAEQWLLDQGSLTEYLLLCSGGNFAVRRLDQRWCRPLLSEQQLLHIPARQWALVREVALLCHGIPWVYARSVMPATTLSGPLRRLRRLQNQSLGALLFRNPGLERDPFELALLPAHSSYLHPHLRQDTPAWGRRSRFSIGGKPLSVSEVFLREFQPRATARIIGRHGRSPFTYYQLPGTDQVR